MEKHMGRVHWSSFQDFQCEMDPNIRKPIPWSETEKERFVSVMKEGGGAVTRELQQKHADNIIDLSYTDLSKLDLRHADLRTAWLVGAQFNGTDLTGADLTGAKLSGACFVQANLNCTHFDETDLEHAYFLHAEASGAHFNGAVLHFTVFDCVNLEHGSFLNTRMHGTYMQRCNIEGVDFTGVKMGSISMLGTCHGTPGRISRAGLALLRAAQDENIEIIE